MAQQSTKTDNGASLHEAPQPMTDLEHDGWWTVPQQPDFGAVVKDRYGGDVNSAARDYLQLFNDRPPLENEGRFVNTFGAYQSQDHPVHN